MKRIRLLSIGAAALFGAGLVAGCGGDDPADEDPRTVLEETFSGEKQVDSGVLDASIDASADDAEGGGSLNASVSGPFQGEGEGQLPSLDLTVALDAEGQGETLNFEGGVIIAEGKGFVTFDGTTYEVDQEIFDAFSQGFEQGQRESAQEGEEETSALLDRLGIDPASWLTNLENQGEEDVEGTATIHISGEADIPRIVADVQKAAAEAGEDVAEIPEEQLGLVESFVEEARIDVFTGVDDRILRRLDVTFVIDVPAGTGVTEGGRAEFSFSVTLGELNEEQTIEAPTDARPLEELLEGLGVPGGLEGLAVPGLGAGGGAGGAAAPGGSDADAAAAPNQEYLDCVAAATSPEDLAACAEEL